MAPTPAQLELARQIVAERERAKSDKLYLATKVLNYDFVAAVHTELFEQFISYDPQRPWAEQSDIRKRLILWPRGHFKTTAVVVEIIQAILNFPDIRIVIMQGKLGTTRRLLREIASHFLGSARGSRLAELFPEFCGGKITLQQATDSFTVPARTRMQLQQATVTVASPRSVKTGQHYDVAFFDDLVNDQNYRSAKLLQKVLDDYNMCLPLLDPPFYAVVTGTRYAFGDLYETIMRADATRAVKEWTTSVKNCWTDDGKGVRFPQSTTVDGRIVGFTREGLLQIRDTDPAMFSSQYLNLPASSSKQLFTEQKLLEACIAEPDAPALSQAVLFVDLAATDQQYSDDSVIIAGKVDHLGKQYVVDGIGGQWTPAQLANQVIAMSLKHRPMRVMIEQTASCLYFVEYLKVLCRDKNVSLPIDFIKVSNVLDAKVIRVSALEGMMRNKHIFFFAGLPCWEKMSEQFVKFPGGRFVHDDYPDTVALMSQFFSAKVQQTTPLSAERHPFLRAIELQGTDISQAVLTQQPPAENDMGDDFTV